MNQGKNLVPYNLTCLSHLVSFKTEKETRVSFMEQNVID